MSTREEMHSMIDEADNVLKFADNTGVGVFARQAGEFAPADVRDKDTVIVVLRGEAARKGRKTLEAAADLVREATR